MDVQHNGPQNPENMLQESPQKLGKYLRKILKISLWKFSGVAFFPIFEDFPQLYFQGFEAHCAAHPLLHVLSYFYPNLMFAQ